MLLARQKYRRIISFNSLYDLDRGRIFNLPFLFSYSMNCSVCRNFNSAKTYFPPIFALDFPSILRKDYYVNIVPKTTIAELQSMEIEDQIDALATIWDQIALKNPAFQVSSADKQLLDQRFAEEENAIGISWINLKKKFLNNKK